MRQVDKTTDEDLVATILSGEKELFYHLVVRYETKLKRYIGTVTNRRNEVDDILQTVFLKTYKNLPTFNKRMKFSSWIYRIAHNESINLIGSSFIQKFVSMPEWFDFGKRDAVEESIDEEQIKERLKGCVNKLDTKYKEPMVLFYYEEKTYDEISDILRIPVRNVGVLIHRGKSKIKKICYEKNNR
ncbi:MAG: RNA polymerase sigma factor [Microgenomates group bacterium]